MAEYIKCRNCESPDCKGCNIKRLETMLENGKFDCMMNENRCINTSADVEPVQEWISVEDRLPQKDGSYLVTSNYFGKNQRIDVLGFVKDGETVDKYNLAGQQYVWYFYDSEYGYVSTHSVTHWMPLPQPPKGE